MRLGRRSVILSATLLATLLAWPGGALAQSACDSSAIDQYVECLPTGGGEDGSGAVGGKPRQTPLPPSVASQVQSEGGEDAGTLQAIATDSRFGAPQEKLAGSKKGLDAELAAADPQADVGAGDALTAAVSAVQGGDGARLVGLLVALFLVSVATLGAAAVRQKRRASS